MARPVRIEYANAAYHVFARGNERRNIFRDDADRRRILETLEQACERYGLIVHAYCLMPNHYHALVQTPRGNLSQAVGWIQSTYSIRFNRRHNRSGHLFQGRFKAHLVEVDSYACSLLTYIHLNPIRPDNKRAPIPLRKQEQLQRYPWSSHRVYAGLCSEKEAPKWLCLDWLSYFGRTRRVAQQQYKRRIAESFGNVIPNPFDELRDGLVFGTKNFLESVKARLGTSTKNHVIRWCERASQEQVKERVSKLLAREEDRRVQIWLRVRVAGERLTSVAQEMGYRDVSGVSRVVQRLEAKAGEDKRLAAHLETLLAKADLSNVKG